MPCQAPPAPTQSSLWMSFRAPPPAKLTARAYRCQRIPATTSIVRQTLQRNTPLCRPFRTCWSLMARPPLTLISGRSAGIRSLRTDWHSRSAPHSGCVFLCAPSLKNPPSRRWLRHARICVMLMPRTRPYNLNRRRTPNPRMAPSKRSLGSAASFLPSN